MKPFEDPGLGMIESRLLILEGKISRMEGMLDEVRNGQGKAFPANWLPKMDERGGSEDPTVWQFGVTVSGKNITVQAGTFLVQGVKTVAYAGTGDTPETATGEYCYPTMKLPINDIDNPVLLILSAMPVLDATNVYIPLVRLKCTDWLTTKLNYTPDGTAYIYHRGVISVHNPIVFSQAAP